MQADHTPQPNRSKFFELQQSNQGYGELQGLKEVQKSAFGKYSIEPFWRTTTLKFLKSRTLWRYLRRFVEERLLGQKKFVLVPLTPLNTKMGL